MSGIPYDDLKTWRSSYPADVFAQQFEKMAAGFFEAIPVLEKAVSTAPREKKTSVKAELSYTKVVRIHFASVANQVRYVMLRDEYQSPDVTPERKTEINGKMIELIEKEISLTKELHALTLDDSRIGFEPSNQYFYVPNDLLEKIVSCKQILEQLKNVKI